MSASSGDPQPLNEREHTDESLRVEREKADDAASGSVSTSQRRLCKAMANGSGQKVSSARGARSTLRFRSMRDVNRRSPLGP